MIYIFSFLQETLEDIDKDGDGYISLQEYIGEIIFYYFVTVLLVSFNPPWNIVPQLLPGLSICCCLLQLPPCFLHTVYLCLYFSSLHIFRSPLFLFPSGIKKKRNFSVILLTGFSSMCPGLKLDTFLSDLSLHICIRLIFIIQSQPFILFLIFYC